MSGNPDTGPRVVIAGGGTGGHQPHDADTDGMVMVYVPGGTFEMGSTEGSTDEQPVHMVMLDSFWIDQTEVTNAMFAEFLNELGNQVEALKNESDIPFPKLRAIFLF